MSKSRTTFFQDFGYQGNSRILWLLVVLRCFQYVHCGLTAVSVNGKPASQSTTYASSYPAWKAVDGNINSFSHTGSGGDPHPWWQVDLGDEHCLGKITVTLRRDCCGNRFIAAVARAGVSANYAENQPCGSPVTPAQSTAGAVNDFLCDAPRMARYVSFDIDISSPGIIQPILQIAELAVKEYPSSQCSDPVELKSAHFERLYKKALIRNSNPLSTKMVRSVALCAKYCTNHAQCFSFDFAKRDGQCHLHSLNATDIEISSGDDDTSVYVVVK